MDGQIYLFVFEILAFIAFIIIVIRELYQRNYWRLFEIMSCAIFGLILEIGNTYLAHTYSYNNNFLFNLAHVPIAIGLGWSVIIYCAMLLSDQYNIPWKLRPFLDAFTAIVLDLAIDAVAIRLGFWNWTIPLDKEWYGVPFENLIGWILVVLSFSFLARFIRTLNYKRISTIVLMFFLPILSYLGLMLGLLIFSLITILPYQINNWTALMQFQYQPDISIMFNPQVQFWKTIFFTIIMTELCHIVVWSLIKYRRNFLKSFDFISFSALTGIHLFFLIAIFCLRLNQSMPILVVIALCSLLVHFLLHLLPYFINHRTIYFFKLVREEALDKEKQLKKIIKKNLK